jgi:hypothetical protein
MWLRLTLRIAAVVMLLAMSRPAFADWHGVGRYWGLGWSDGYHARNACPPRRGIHHHGEMAVPWWAVPAADGEALPHPAAPRKVSTARPMDADGLGRPSYRPTHPDGPTLFRQPGEGSSVLTLESPLPSPSASPQAAAGLGLTQ